MSKQAIGQINYSFLVGILVLASFGLLMLLSAASYESEKLTGNPHTFFLQQASTMLVTLTLMIVTSLVDYRYLRRTGWLLSFLALICLLLIEFSPWGKSSGGAQRWLQIGNFSFQPSEIVKISVLILMADGLAKAQWLSGKIIKRLLLCTILAFLILKQPDLGTTIVILVSCFCLLFIRGLNWGLGIFSLMAGVGVFWLSLLQNTYQMKRINGWLYPQKDPLGTGYNLLQSYYAVGSGGLWGTGYGNSLQKLGYLPVSYADFIFAIICEELGFIGLLLVIGLFLYLLWESVSTCLMVPDTFGKLLGIGIVFSLILQVIFNLGGVIGLLPVTGMPLPFISYGKTSLIVTGFMLGILLNLSKYKLNK